jgi:hypothetical protein
VSHTSKDHAPVGPSQGFPEVAALVSTAYVVGFDGKRPASAAQSTAQLSPGVDGAERVWWTSAETGPLWSPFGISGAVESQWVRGRLERVYEYDGHLRERSADA